jgi:hypothetical protein
VANEFSRHVEGVLTAFRTLANACPHRYSDVYPDCYHPASALGRMLCAPCNCPLLLVEKDAPEIDLECFRGEDPTL